jgi:hypothetical protein
LARSQGFCSRSWETNIYSNAHDLTCLTISQDIFQRGSDRVGIIEYERAEDMDMALRKLDDADLKGNRVRVIEVGGL